MSENFENLFTARELLALSSILQVGDSAYWELMEMQHPLFKHPYFSDTRGRIRTKIVQMQCEIESHDPKFPFDFFQREFLYNQIVPELRNKNVIVHIARSKSIGDLPYPSRYKIRLSNNNNALQRQMIIDPSYTPPYGDEPFYALLVFGGHKNAFSAIQFPEPGYGGIAKTITLPQISFVGEDDAAEVFERKKAVLKKEFMAQRAEEVVS